MSETGTEIKVTGRFYCTFRTNGHTQIAFKARVEVDWPVLVACMAFDKYRSKHDEISEFGMDHISMGSHARLYLPGGKAVIYVSNIAL